MMGDGNAIMGNGMMWGMGIVSLLFLVLLLLAIVALAKYVFGPRG